MRYTTERQGTPEWHALRLGRITSTAAAALMSKAKKVGELSATARKEIYRIKAERNLKKEYKTFLINEYLERVGIKTAALEFGKKTEEEARNFYTVNTGYNITEVAFITPDDDDLEPFWGDSPDGVIFDADHKLVGCIEIKCPNSATFMEYSDMFAHGKTLKEIEPKYYWQVLNHLAVSGAEWCDFIVYDPMLKSGYLCNRIMRSDVISDIDALKVTIKATIKNLKNE